MQETVQENILENKAENVDTVTLEEEPNYELKLVDRNQETNEEEILVALQEKTKITYKYYEIALNNNAVENVNTLEEAETLINTLKEENPKEDIGLTVAEKCTENLEEVKTDSVEIAKTTINKKMAEEEVKELEEVVGKDAINTEEGIVNGVRLAVKPVSGTITSRYGESSRIRSSTHTGLDIACSTGTPIKVTADGTVTFSAYNGSYGNLVKVSHENGVETWYAHCSKLIATVGQTVKVGDVIALVGSTGNSTGSHLHFEVRINGTHVNPQKYIY